MGNRKVGCSGDNGNVMVSSGAKRESAATEYGNFRHGMLVTSETTAKSVKTIVQMDIIKEWQLIIVGINEDGSKGFVKNSDQKTKKGFVKNKYTKKKKRGKKNEHKR